MKKIFSLLLMLFVGVGMWAADETVVFSEQGYSNQQAVESYSGTDFTVTFNKGTNNNAPKYYTTGAAIRVYGGSYFTVSSTTKTIAKIELGFGSGEGSNAISTDVETYSNGTWTGSASSVTFTIGGTTGHRRIASIAVTFDNGAVYVATPEISGATPFATSTQVTITCATEGASIYYTLDGATPTANSTAYSGPFSLTATTTVKAIAYDANNNASGVVSKEFVKIPSVATVAEFNALAQGSNFMFTGEGLVATVQKGNYLYAQDETGGMLIYGTISPEYTKGDVIPAGFTATKAEYNGAAQAGTPQNMEDAVDSQTVTAKEFVAADFAAATFAELSNFGIYGVVRGVTVNGNTLTLADGTTVVNTYNTFANAPTTAAGDIYDVYGIMGWHNGVQLLPIDYQLQAATAHAAPVITLNPEKEVYFVGDEVTVKFTSEETDVNIGYDITDAETFPENYCVPVSNGDSITVTADEPKTVTVRAFAYGYNEGDALGNSEVVTKTLTFVAKPELGDQYELVTSADQIAADKEYVLAYSDETVTVAMGAAATYGSNNVRVSVEAGSSEFTLEDGVITLMSTTTVTPFTLETSETEGFYNIKIDDDQYIYWTSGNTAATGTTLGDVTVALDSVGNALIKYNVTEDRYLQYNANSPRFCFYKGTQKYPKLYVKVAATPDVKLGDVNGDGDVNVNDVTVLINYILGKNPTPFVEANANVNGDEGINVNDVTALINLILN